MNIEMNIPITGLDGQPIEGSHAGKTLATVLVSQPEGEVIKLYDWALKLYNGQPIELDRADKEYLVNFIKKSPALTLLVKKQLLDVCANGTP
jgi:hypothetical protein